MNEKRWVCHISGQGEKWEVLDGRPPGLQNDFRPMDHHEWIVRARVGSEQYVKRWFALPKSEYRLCEPPEVWRDVTEECVVICGVVLSHQGADVNAADGYRLRKVELHPLNTLVGKQWAFIVEQKVTE